MITAAFLLAGVIIDVICIHSASSVADPNQIGTNPNPDTRYIRDILLKTLIPVDKL